jgi:hypothetical protein
VVTALTSVRPLAEVCQVARTIGCSHCLQTPDLPCVTGPDGLHVARFARAYKIGLLSKAEIGAVLHAVPIFRNSTVIYERGAQS